MGLYSNYKTDVNKEVNGVPVEFGTNDDGTVITFILSRMGASNKQYVKALEAAQKPFRRQIQLGTLPQETNERIFREVFANTVLKGWVNVRDENEQDLPFNFVNAIKVLTDLPDLYDDLFRQANTIDLFRSEALEEDAKN